MMVNGLSRFGSGGRHGAFENLAHRREGAPVMEAWTEALKRFEMFWRAVALMSRKSVVRELAIKRHHDAVAGDLCDDRGGGNRHRFGIALDDALGGAGEPRRNIPIDQSE